MLTAICTGLLLWLIFVAWEVWTNGEIDLEWIPAMVVVLLICVAFCVVIQHFGSMLIGALS